MKLLFALALCFALSSAFKWNCTSYMEPEERFNKSVCVVVNVTDEVLRSSESLDDEPPADVLMLVNITAPPEDLWREENFKSIQYVYISSTNITQIVVPSNVKFLSLNDIHFEQLLSANASELMSLEFAEMQLENLPTNLSQFHHLNVISGRSVTLNHLNMTSLSGMHHLKSIQFGEGKIHSVTLSGLVILPSLVTLQLDNSKLSEVPDELHKLAALQTLTLARNNIRFVEMGRFNGLDQLQSLDLSYNYGMRISTMSTLRLPNLENLSLETCWLEYLDVQHWEMPKLKMLNVKNNNLHEVTNFRNRFPTSLEMNAANNYWACIWLDDNSRGVSFKEDPDDGRYVDCEHKTAGVCCPGKTRQIDVGRLLEKKVELLEYQNFVLNTNLMKQQKQLDEIKRMLVEISVKNA